MCRYILKRFLFLVVIFGFCEVVFARETGNVESYLLIPATESLELQYEGGAAVNIEGDYGFGFGFGGYYSDNVAAKVDFTWNSSSYAGQRILDDGNNTAEGFSGGYQSFAITVGADYYLTDGAFSPFLNVNMGYSYIDSNIPAGSPATSCWWDPWYGYLCDTYRPTYAKDSWFYGAGLGLRLDVEDRFFVKVGYYNEWVDFDRARNDPAVETIKFEFGRVFK